MVVLDQFRQNPTEDMSTYVCGFYVLCDKWVENLLNGNTIKCYFICDFDGVSTIESIYSRQPKKLDEVFSIALEIKLIQKEN